MSPRTVTLFFALLAVASAAVVVGAGALALLARVRPEAAALRGAVVDEVRGRALPLAAVVTTVATLGSLYLSEIAGFPPCTLCWVQRGFMYPLAALLWVAAWRGWTGIAGPARLWALAGGAVSVWHVAVERLPDLAGSGVCDPLNPCSIRWVEHFGVVTIPVMALAAFALATVLLSVRPAAAAAHPATARPDTESIR